MYERSAIVLEKYFNNMFGFNQKVNLKSNYKNYKELVEEIKKYQEIISGEEKVINEFDEIANEIRNIQQEQKKLYKSNVKLEEERNQIFEDLDETPALLEKKLEKIENTVEKNNTRYVELKEKFVSNLGEFADRQKERNKIARTRRSEEAIHLQLVKEVSSSLGEIEEEKIKELKSFVIAEDDSKLKNEISKIMIDNGKDERVGFDVTVIEEAVTLRLLIAKKEAECYLLAYDRMKKILAEIDSDEIKLDKYIKSLRDISIKLEFLKAEKSYIISFLDNERMSAMNGPKAHKKMMQDACISFKSDIEQINNLYELLLKEISGKVTKKAYSELYNKEYLKKIEEKEKNFEEEINSIKINAGTIINSNYWRIDGIKNLYQVFKNEVTEKFGKDLSEFEVEEVNAEEIPEEEEKNEPSIDDILEYKFSRTVKPKTKIPQDLEEDNEEDQEDDDYEEQNEDENKEYNNEYEDSEYDDEIEYEDDYDDEYDDYDEYEDGEDEFDEDDDGELEDSEEYEDEEQDDEDEKGKNSKGIFNKFFGDRKK